MELKAEGWPRDDNMVKISEMNGTPPGPDSMAVSKDFKTRKAALQVRYSVFQGR